MATDYIVKIEESSREFTARERLMFKDFSNAQQLDTLCDGETPIRISPVDYAILSVHNDKSKDKKDYRKFVIIDKAGNKFITGSESFIKAYKEIKDEMGEEEFEIDCYKVPSKNYVGKSFITCSIV